jgi:hypothetical protein
LEWKALIDRCPAVWGILKGLLVDLNEKNPSVYYLFQAILLEQNSKQKYDGGAGKSH